ncbi:SDR family oxidoreductase [Brachybacterium sp. FME24]|uniref:SDR family oxidoreductase n=1 Tax=Brachybacterium sp. FME24 TaxID=2742605 RepID=UPI0018693349|nr:SDR family oxidoreductase [Brachybacterium sp. FME24]
MHITGATALITGANRGLGRALAQRLLERGATTVYATARDPEAIDLPGVEPLRLDITDPAQIAAVAEQASGVDLLINNAGIQSWTDLLTGDLEGLQRELDTNLFGTLRMARAFAPGLAAHGGGAIVNVASAMSWFAHTSGNGYHVSKAANWAASNGLRLELASQSTLVTSVHLGLADTDMGRAVPGEKAAPHDVADAVLDGVEAGQIEVLVDDWSRHVKASLAKDPHEFYGLG